MHTDEKFRSFLVSVAIELLPYAVTKGLILSSRFMYESRGIEGFEICSRYYTRVRTYAEGEEGTKRTYKSVNIP